MPFSRYSAGSVVIGALICVCGSAPAQELHSAQEMCRASMLPSDAYVPPVRLGAPEIHLVTAPDGLGPADGGVEIDVEFLDCTNGTGVGFDDPVFGAARQATALAVMEYLCTTLDHTGGLSILFIESQTDGTGPRGQAQPLFNPVPGCAKPFGFTHLTTGVDPAPNLPDGQIVIDFGYNFNSELDLPAPDERDLASLLLHEVTHVLGFISGVINADGTGPLNSNPDARSKGFDDLIETLSGEQIIQCDAGLFVGDPDDLTGLPSLRHGGQAAGDAWKAINHSGRPPIFSPPTFVGASMDHWDQFDPLMPCGAVMIPVHPVGSVWRTYTGLDAAALVDYGYSLTASCVGDLDGNGVVDEADALIVVGQLGFCGCCQADLDGNEIVNIGDVLIVQLNMGTCWSN